MDLVASAKRVVHIGLDIVKVLANGKMAHSFDCPAADVIPAADRENQAKPLITRIGFNHDIGGGIIGILVHRIGTVQLFGRGEADVEGRHADDPVAQVSACLPDLYMQSYCINEKQDQHKPMNPIRLIMSRPDLYRLEAGTKT
jgi:hypothetical protein